MGGRSALKALWMTDCSPQPIPASPPLFFFFFSVLLFEAVSGFSRGFTWLLRSPASFSLIVNLWKCQHMRKETTSIPQQRKIHLKMVSVRSKKPIYNICDPHRLRSPHCVADSFTDRLVYDLPLSSFQASAWRRHWNGEPRKLDWRRHGNGEPRKLDWRGHGNGEPRKPDWRGHGNGEPQQLKEDMEALCSCSLKKEQKKMCTTVLGENTETRRPCNLRQILWVRLERRVPVKFLILSECSILCSYPSRPRRIGQLPRQNQFDWIPFPTLWSSSFLVLYIHTKHW